MLKLVLLLAFLLRIYGISWGISDLLNFHQDESLIAPNVIKMINGSTLNPHFFMYPSLMFYILYSLYWVSYFILNFLGFYPTKEIFFLNIYNPTFILIARFVSVSVGTISVYLLYLISKELFDKKNALISASIFSLLPINVEYSHLAVTDTLMVFFLLLTVLYAIKYVKVGTQKYLILSSIFAGLCFGTKYPGVSSILITFTALFLKGNLRIKTLIYILIIFTSTFLITTPYSILSFNEFFEQLRYIVNTTTRGYGYNVDTLDGLLSIRGVYPIFISFPFLFGFPLYFVLIFGLVYSFKRYKELLLFLPFLIFYFVMSTTWVNVFLRYLLPFTPFAAIISAIGISDLIHYNKKLGYSIFLITLTYTFIFTSSLIDGFNNDTRVKSKAYLDSLSLDNSSIMTSSYSFYIKNYLPFSENITYIESVRPDYLVLSSKVYLRSYRNKLFYKDKVEFYDSLFNGKLNYTLDRRFEIKYFNEEIYKQLEPMYTGYISPLIEIYKRN